MNYRHVYHAGSAADVLKHVVMTRLILYLQRKDGGFRVIDTHSGAGLYDLSSAAAQKTGEWRSGIGRLVAALPGGLAGTLLQPYLDAVQAFNPPGSLIRYPGSPLVARRLLRRQDRLTAIEKHAETAALLKEALAGDFQARVLTLDGWLALGAHLPPKERRGLVLVDPPFEAEGEFERLTAGLVKAHRRWPGGLYALWYPIKDRAAVAIFRAALVASGIPRLLDIRLETRAPSPEPRLTGSGLIVVNPPFTLENELATLLPVLAKALADGAGGHAEAVWLAGETAV